MGRRDPKAGSHYLAIVHAHCNHDGFGQQVLRVVVFLTINQPNMSDPHIEPIKKVPWQLLLQATLAFAAPTALHR